MCYGGCDCERCCAPPVIRTRCVVPVVVLDQKFEGWESLQDWDRDMSEALDQDFNPKAGVIPEDYTGTIRVVITYTPEQA